MKSKRPSGLCMTRKPTQSVQIGDAIVYFTSVRGDNVHIVIEAPKDVPIIRSELNTSPPKEGPLGEIIKRLQEKKRKAA